MTEEQRVKCDAFLHSYYARIQNENENYGVVLCAISGARKPSPRRIKLSNFSTEATEYRDFALRIFDRACINYDLLLGVVGKKKFVFLRDKLRALRT